MTLNFLSRLESELKQTEQEIWSLQGEINHISDSLTEYEEEKIKSEKLENELERVKIILQSASEEARKKACENIEQITTKALQYVFGSQYAVKLELKEMRGKPDATILVSTEIDGEIAWLQPEESRGGGLVDVISIALRFALTEIWNQPKLQGPILLDEPGKHVSEEYAVKLSQFIDYLQRQFNRQVIMITHQPHMAEMADKQYEVSQTDGTSKVTKL